MANRKKLKDQESSTFSVRMSRRGLYLLFVLVPLIHHEGLFSFTILPKRLLTQIVLLLIVVAWLRDYRNKSPVNLHHSPLNLPILLYALAMVVSIGQAINPLSGLLSLSHHLTYILLFFVLISTFPISAFHGLLRLCASIGILVSILGIFEARGFDMSWLLSNGRPSATFGYRNFAAAYLVMSIPLSLYLCLRGKLVGDYYLGLTSTGLMTVFLIYTRTRGAWGGLAGSLLVCALLAGHARYHWKTPFDISRVSLRSNAGKIFLIGTILMTTVLSLFEPRIASQQVRAIDEKKVELLDALTSVTAPGGDRERRHMWKQTGRLIQDHLVMGVGVGNWKHTYPVYDGGIMLRPGSAPERPHNDFIWIWSEVGAIGLMAYLWILLALLFAVIRILKRSRSSEETYLAIALCTSLLATMGHSLFSFPRDLAETSLIFWSGLALLALLDLPRKTRQVPRPGMLNFLLFTTLLLTTATIWFTYRYVRFDAQYLRANQFHKGGDYRAMLKASSYALSYGPFDHQAYLFQAKGYQSAGLSAMALASAKQGLAYHPHSAELHGDLGRYYAEIDSLEAADRHLNRALELSPTYYQMYNNLGSVYQKDGNFEAAITAYRRALQHDSTNVGILNNLGLAQLEAGRVGPAIHTFESALDLAPGELWIQHNLGEALFQKSADDSTVLPSCLEAYQTFLQIADRMGLPESQTATARRRVNEIRTYLGGKK